MSRWTSKTLGPVTITNDRNRPKGGYMGRFGGGWQYRLGLTVGEIRRRGKTTVLLGLWTREYRIVIDLSGD